MFKSMLFIAMGLLAGLFSFLLLPVIGITFPLLAIPGFFLLSSMKITQTDTLDEHFDESTLDWQAWPPQKQPKVWIVDDDKDMAILMQAGLESQGIRSDIITDPSDLHRKISFDEVDFILLDWMLSSNLTADMVMRRAIRIIGTFSDLQQKFQKHPAQVVTYSALEEDKIHVPESEFFHHLGHLDKSTPYQDMIHHLSGWINSQVH
jgi:CheY-like chemotaxis protein